MRQFWAALVVLMSCATMSFAHYNMLLPDKAWANKGDKVTFTYQFGHPFEHELFDAPEPKAVIVILPGGKTQKIEKLTKLSVPGADGKKVTAFSFIYEPAMRGDHTVVLQTPPIWMEESKEFVQDSVKIVLHVQTQKKWDAGFSPHLHLGSRLKITPLTRPYGLLPGMTFQAQVESYYGKDEGRGGAGYRELFGEQIEVERFNPKPAKALPPDELITFKTKTDRNGVFTFGFPEPGWWSMTASHQEKNRQWKGDDNQGLLRERTTLWIHVDEKK